VHVPQIYYCIAFTAVFFAPHLVGIKELKRATRTLCGSARCVYFPRRSRAREGEKRLEHALTPRPCRRVALTMAVLAVMCLSIKKYTCVDELSFPSASLLLPLLPTPVPARHDPSLARSPLADPRLILGFFTDSPLRLLPRDRLSSPPSLARNSIAHPFLLADNRHYAFYLWRRVINVHPLARYALAPGYLVSATLLWHGLGALPSSSRPPFSSLAHSTLAPLPPRRARECPD